MNKFNFKPKIMAPVLEVDKNKNNNACPIKENEPVCKILTPQEKKDEEIYKEEQEITHEIDPEKEKYLPGEKLLKKLNRSKSGHKKRTKKNIIDTEELNDDDITRLIALLKKKR